MPTPIFICGAECGIVVTGTASGGTEHWVQATGGSVVTSGPSPMRSTRCFSLTDSVVLQHTFATAIASPATAVARFYIYFTTLPTSSGALIYFQAAGGATLALRFATADNSLRAGDLTAAASSGAVVTTGVWYRVDLKLVMAATRTVDLQVDGVAQAQYSAAISASDISHMFIGGQGLGAVFYLDDIIVSGTTADYPIGAGTVVGLYPNGDKTNSAANPTDGNGGHLYSAIGDFGKGSGGTTSLGTQNAEATSWQSLSKPLVTAIPTNFIADQGGGTAEHLVWTLEDMPAAASIFGVMLVAATHSATATANNQTMKLKDAANNLLTAWSLLDLSELTITVPIFVATTAPDGGAWTSAKVNACLIQWGDSSDVSPNPRLDGVCLEVDYVPLPADVLHTDPYRQLMAQ